jgi:hypothetical protein
MRKLRTAALFPLTASLTALCALGSGCTGEPLDGSGELIDQNSNPNPAADDGPGAAARSVVEGGVAPGTDAALIAGEGAGPATQVRVHERSGGQDTLVGEGSVASDGSFSVDVPAGAHRLIISAVDGQGRQAAAGILDVSAAEGAVAPMPDLGGESTLEAETARALASCDSIENVDTVDLQGRITPALASALASSIAGGGSPDIPVYALAQGIGAAQATELAALAGAGSPTTRQALFESGLPASIQLRQALSSGADPDLATDAFAGSVQRARAAVVGAAANAQAQVASALALGGFVRDLGETYEEIDGIIDDILIGAVAPFGLAGVIEVLDELMDAFTDTAFEQLAELLESFDLSPEGTTTILVTAVSGLLNGIMGVGGILSDIPILGDLLGGGLLEDSLALAEARRLELDDDVAAAAAAADNGEGQCADFGSLAAGVAQAHSEFSDDIHAGVADRADDGLFDPPASQVTAMAEMLALFEGMLSVVE